MSHYISNKPVYIRHLICRGPELFVWKENIQLIYVNMHLEGQQSSSKCNVLCVIESVV